MHKGIKKNYLSFAGGGKNTRSTQLFIAFEDLDFLGKEPWETPFGIVTEGQSTLDALYKGYGDIPPFGHGPDQQKIHNRGNKYLHDQFPLVDYILSCNVIDEELESTDAPLSIPLIANLNEEESVPEKVEDVIEVTAFVPPQATDDASQSLSSPKLLRATGLSFNVPKLNIFHSFLFLSGIVIAFAYALHLQKRIVSISKQN